MIAKRSYRIPITLTVFAVALGFASRLVCGQVVLVYDATDGSVQIDTNDLQMISFSLQNEPGEPSFNTPNTLFSGLPTPLLPPDNTSTQIGWIAQDFNTGFTGVADLGNIFPPGMSKEDVEAFTSIPGTVPPQGRAYGLGPVPPGGGGEMDVVVVPESAAHLMICLGAVFVAFSFSRSRRIKLVNS